MDKEDVVCMCVCTYTYMYIGTRWNIIQPLKRKAVFPFATTRMDLEGMMLSETSQTEKDKYYMVSFICGI